jgi:hypothetical protein
MCPVSTFFAEDFTSCMNGSGSAVQQREKVLAAIVALHVTMSMVCVPEIMLYDIHHPCSI